MNRPSSKKRFELQADCKRWINERRVRSRHGIEPEYENGLLELGRRFQESSGTYYPIQEIDAAVQKILEGLEAHEMEWVFPDGIMISAHNFHSPEKLVELWEKMKERGFPKISHSRMSEFLYIDLRTIFHYCDTPERVIEAFENYFGLVDSLREGEEKKNIQIYYNDIWTFRDGSRLRGDFMVLFHRDQPIGLVRLAPIDDKRIGIETVQGIAFGEEIAQTNREIGSWQYPVMDYVLEKFRPLHQKGIKLLLRIPEEKNKSYYPLRNHYCKRKKVRGQFQYPFEKIGPEKYYAIDAKRPKPKKQLSRAPI